MQEKMIKVPAAADEHMDEELLGLGVRFVREVPEGQVQENDCSLADAVEASTRELGQKLVRCGKWALGFGFIHGVLFWWLQSGMLAPEAAWPGMVVCALLGGLAVGYNAR